MRKKKIKEKLEEVEKGCYARTLDLEKRLKKAKSFVEEVKKLLGLNYSDLKYVYHNGNNCGKWPYIATKVTFEFHKTTLNTVKSAEFERLKFFEEEEKIILKNASEFSKKEKYLMKKLLNQNGFSFRNNTIY